MIPRCCGWLGDLANLTFLALESAPRGGDDKHCHHDASHRGRVFLVISCSNVHGYRHTHVAKVLRTGLRPPPSRENRLKNVRSWNCFSWVLLGPVGGGRVLYKAASTHTSVEVRTYMPMRVCACVF